MNEDMTDSQIAYSRIDESDKYLCENCQEEYDESELCDDSDHIMCAGCCDSRDNEPRYDRNDLD